MQAFHQQRLRQMFMLIFISVVSCLAQPNEATALSVLGCELNLDTDAIKRCLDGKISELQRALDDARARADQIQRAADGQINDLNRQLNEAKQQLLQLQSDTNRKIAEAVAAATASKNKELAVLQARLTEAEKRAAMIGGQLQAGERQALQAIRDLQQEALLQCIQKAPASPITRISDSVLKINSTPGEFPKIVFQHIWSLAEADIEGLMREELNVLRGVTAPPTQASQLIDGFWEKVKRISARDPGLRCIVDYIDPQIPQLRRAADDIQNEMMRKAQQFFDQKIRPLIYEAIAKQIAQLIDKDPAGDGEVMNAIARGVVINHVLNAAKVNFAADRLHNLAMAVSNKSLTRQLLLEALAALDDASFHLGPDLYVDVAVELLKYKGHKQLHSDAPPSVNAKTQLTSLPGGGWILDQALGTGTTLASFVVAEIDSACGLVPEVGAVICANATEPGKMVWEHLVRPALKSAVFSGVDALFNAAVDYTKSRLMSEAGKIDPQLAEKRAKAGRFGQELDRLQSAVAIAYAKKYITPTTDSIEHYRLSVRELTQAAAGQSTKN